jgi:hypothetical protein
MKETEKAYLAGLIDGEGTVSIVRLRHRGPGFEHYVASVEISNTNVKMIDWVMERLGGSVVVDARKKVSGQKQVYRIGLRNKLAEKVLLEVLPYLVLKGKQAELVLELRSRTRRDGDRRRLTSAERAYRSHLYEECGKLNVRGHWDAERLSERTSERTMRQSELAGNEPREGEPKSLPASV